MQTDINCDMGEGIGNDELIMPYISSANIACGYHAGTAETIKTTIDYCIKYNVAIGAHPSFYDKENFGRMQIHLSANEIYDLVTQQLIIFNEVISVSEKKINHVKPHGALYNMAAKDIVIAASIAKAVKDFDPALFIYGLSGSHSISEAKKIGLKTLSEVFADRTYQDDGTLTPRSQPGALIENEIQALQQVLEMIQEGTTTTVTGKKISIVAETICIHGDGKNAGAFAKEIHDAARH